MLKHDNCRSSSIPVGLEGTSNTGLGGVTEGCGMLYKGEGEGRVKPCGDGSTSDKLKKEL